jgi:hypothetical protein
VPSARRDIGIRICQENCGWAQPSIVAASSTSARMLRKQGRRMVIETGSRNAALMLASTIRPGERRSRRPPQGQPETNFPDRGLPRSSRSRSRLPLHRPCRWIPM